jgi:Mg2+ and Co2+ transporter CorA
LLFLISCGLFVLVAPTAKMSDVEQGLGNHAEAKAHETYPTTETSRPDEEEEKKEAYLKRFWRYCEEHDISLTEQDFSNTVEEAYPRLGFYGSVIVGAQADRVLMRRRIALKDVILLGAYFDVDPGFFAHHAKARCADATIQQMVVKDSYWSITCSYELGSQEDLRRLVQVSFTTLRNSQSKCCGAAYILYTCLRFTVLSLVDGFHGPLWDSIKLPMLARYETGLLEHPDLRLKDRVWATAQGGFELDAADYFKELFSFPPVREILRSMVGSNASVIAAYFSFAVLMKLATWYLSLNDLAAVSRELDSEATIKPSKIVLRRLNKCRSLVLRALNDVVQLREKIERDPPFEYRLLCDSMIAVKMQHPDFHWIPLFATATKPVQENTDDEDKSKVSLLLRMLNRLELQAEKQSTRLRETFQTLTTAIAIEDSDFNKKQAQRSTMLTLLAAIYLPLTLATGIFGMNIKEINGGKPRWWVVVAVTAVLFVPSIAFTILLFAGDGANLKQRLQGNKDRNGTSKSKVRTY